MRRAFIGFGLVVFAVYCWASVAYQNRVPVPDYKLVDVDLLGGMTRAAWDATPQTQFQQLMLLEGKKYQLPENSTSVIPANRPLTSDDFAKLIAAAPAGQGVTMKLRDTSAIYGLLAHNYLLRDDIPAPGNPDGPPLYAGGTPLDKKMLDNLRQLGWKTITITGHAPPVNFQVGTALMVAIIFLTLVAALKPVIWGPFMVLLEKRRRELEIGAEAERQNQIEASRYEEESRRRNADLHRNVQELRMRTQRDTTKQTGEILREAREQEKAVKIEGLRELDAAAREAGSKLDSQMPELAEAVADLLTPGRRRSSGEGKQES